MLEGEAAGWQELGVTYEIGQAQLGLGRCLGKSGQDRLARQALTSARSAFASLGAGPALAEAERLLRLA